MQFSYDPTVGDIVPGGISISSSELELNADFSFSLDISWRINGFLQKEFTSYWNTGEGDYYWYRIEGTCGEIKCDEYGVQYPDCKRMTFFTAVAARNLGEVCDLLRAPKYTAPMNLEISAIQKYSRPVAKENILDDECNILEEQEFCQVAQCLDYCVDQDVVVYASLTTRVIEAIYEHQPIGSITLQGKATYDRYLEHIPDSSLGLIEGDVEIVTLRLLYSSDGALPELTSTRPNLVCTRYDYSSEGNFILNGQSSFVSPYKKHDSYLSLSISGGAQRIYRNYTPKLGLEFSGESDLFLRHRYNPIGSLTLYGIIEDYGSPSYYYSSNGSILTSGSASFNFYNMGVFASISSFLMSSFDLKLEVEELQYADTLTIDDATTNPTCGCGPLGMTILLKHNFNNSTVLSNFFRRNRLQFPEQVYLRHKSEDLSWRSVQHFKGRGRDGVSFEDWTVFFTFSCISDLDAWRFNFVLKSSNKTTNEDLQTKFITDIPADLICSDNNIATTIRINIGSGELVIARNQQTFVVSPPRTPRQTTRRTTTTVDGIFNDYLVYYDTLGLFKNSYWMNTPLEININPVSREEMPVANLQSIF